MILDDLFEMSSGGSTSAGSVASINTPLGGASGFDRDYSKSIYDAPFGIKTRRKKRKKISENISDDVWGWYGSHLTLSVNKIGNEKFGSLDIMNPENKGIRIHNISQLIDKLNLLEKQAEQKGINLNIDENQEIQGVPELSNLPNEQKWKAPNENILGKVEFKILADTDESWGWLADDLDVNYFLPEHDDMDGAIKISTPDNEIFVFNGLSAFFIILKKAMTLAQQKHVDIYTFNDEPTVKFKTGKDDKQLLKSMGITEDFKVPNTKPGDRNYGEDIQAQTLANFIRKNCKIAFNAYLKTNHYLVRQESKTSDTFFVAHSPINRIPSDTRQKYQAAVDKKLNDTGFKALRSNSIFCFRNKLNTDYHPNYAIFPIDGFDSTYSSIINDLTTKYKLGDFPSYYDAMPNNKFKQDLIKLGSKEFVHKYKFDKNFEVALTKNGEILVRGKYLAIKLDSKILKEVQKLLKTVAKKKIKMSETLIGSTKPYKEPKALSATEKVKSIGPILGGNPNKRQKPLNKKFVGCSVETLADKIISEKPHHKSSKPLGPMAQYKCINTITRNGKGTQCGATFVSAKDEKLRYGKKCPHCGSGTAFHDKITDLSESKMKNLNKAMWKQLNESKLKSTPENVYKVANILAEKYHSLFRITMEDMADQLINDFANADNGLSFNDLAINDIIDLKKPANMHGKIYKIGTDDDKDETIISFKDVATGKKYTTNIGNIIKKH